MNKSTFAVSGMHCASCASVITKRISKLAGVESVEVSLGNQTAKITYQENKVTVKDFNQEVGKLGYKLTQTESASKESRQSGHAEHMSGDVNRAEVDKQQTVAQEEAEVQFVLPLALIIFGLMIWDMLAKFINAVPRLPMPMHLFNTISFVLATIVMVQYAKPFVRAVGRFIQYGAANMDTLVGIGTMTAYLYSALLFLAPNIGKYLNLPEYLYFDVAIIVVGFIKYGKLLELKSQLKTGEAIKKLMHLGAKKALVIRNGKQQEIAIDQVKVGDRLLVKPGQKIPTDGIITKGASSIDESMVTGESFPVDKKINDIVIGATINKHSAFEMRATRVGDQTVLSQIVAMVQEAQGSKAPIERLVDKISAVFVPATLIFSLMVLVLWVGVGSFYMPVTQAISLGLVSTVGILVIACPCALGLATPTAVVVAVGKAAQNGILIKNAESLEKSYHINYVIFDKTGTLTKGKPAVESILVVDQKSTQKEVVVLAASLEKLSEHPLSQAVVDEADKAGVHTKEVKKFSIIEGKGIVGNVDGQTYWIGNAALMGDKNLVVDHSYVMEASKRGKTVIMLANNKQILAYITMADGIKHEANNTIKSLHKLGIRTAMLTGDHQQTAQAIASSLGIDEVIAEVLPSDKAEQVRKIQSKGYRVAMVGDGVNDAPALATADVGIAMATGTDVAIESAGITLLSGDLSKLMQTFKLAKRTMKIIKQNLFWAFFYNSVGIPIAAGILYPFLGIMLNPAIAGAAMAFSSVSVVTNSLRLKTVKL